MDNQYSVDAWASRKPILNRLPYIGYQDNSAVSNITQYPDEVLSTVGDILQNWYKELNPLTCNDSSLDYIASLAGIFTGHWDTRWQPQVKRTILIEYNSLYRNRGTMNSLSRMITILGVNCRLWLDGQVVLPSSLPFTFGTKQLRVFFRMPLETIRQSPQWSEAARIINYWVPATVTAKVSYEYFYLGLSTTGEPLYEI